MADSILKFMIGHLGPGSNVQLGLLDFKVCDCVKVQVGGDAGFSLCGGQ